MSHIAKFPYGGDELVIYDREDILKTIDENIVDKEVLTDIINHLEFDVYSTLSTGRWTGYPYLGSFKFKEFKIEANKPEVVEALDAAKKILPKEQYIAFKKRTYRDINYNLKYKKIYTYALSRCIKNNRCYYTKKYNKYGENFAKLATYMASNAKPSICDCIELGYVNK